MNPDHAHFAEWDAAYALGALAPADRREYEEHLETCQQCRRSLAELAPMPGLLARLSSDRAEALLEPAVAPAPRAELLAAVQREDRRRRRRRTVWLAAAATLAVFAVVAGVVVASLVLAGGSRESRSVAFDSIADVPLSATATLTQVGWGTSIELDCRYARGSESDGSSPESWPYALVVVDADGGSREVSSWRATAGSTARLAAATALDLDEIAALEIRSLDGDVLMRARPG